MKTNKIPELILIVFLIHKIKLKYTKIGIYIERNSFPDDIYYQQAKFKPPI